MHVLKDKLEQIRGGKILDIQVERRMKAKSDGMTGAGFYHWESEGFWLHVELPNGEVVGVGVEAGKRADEGSMLCGSVGEIDDPESLYGNLKEGAE
tara:strand:- start:617 stop:904 length:288 start_codon:yes stop_codon:yes gene_type:complete